MKPAQHDLIPVSPPEAAVAGLAFVQVIYLFIFINRIIRSFFLYTRSCENVNEHASQNEDESTSTLFEHSARQIISDEKRKKNSEIITAGSACQCVDLKSSLQGS